MFTVNKPFSSAQLWRIRSIELAVTSYRQEHMAHSFKLESETMCLHIGGTTHSAAFCDHRYSRLSDSSQGKKELEYFEKY